MTNLSHMSVHGGCDAAPISFLPAGGFVFDLRGGAGRGGGGGEATTSTRPSSSASPSPSLLSNALSRSNGGNRRGGLNVAKKAARNAFYDTYALVAAKWYRLPQVSRYFVSGNLGNVCFFLLEKSIHRLLHDREDWVPDWLPVSKHTLSFVVAYMAQVIPQHFLHALLVYGLRTINTPAKYGRTLAGTYSAFALSMVGSTALNSVLIRFVSKDAAFMSTIVVFAIVNYFAISWIVRVTTKPPSSTAMLAGHASARSARTRRKEKDSNHGDAGLLSRLMVRGGGRGATAATSSITRSLSTESWNLVESNVVDLT
jgi:hypothetical protein